MKDLLLGAAMALSLPSAVTMAQVRPQPGAGDPRIQSVAYDPQQVVQLQVAPGYQLTIEFGPGERVENVALGDSGAWQATPNKRGDRVFIKTSGGVTTNLSVITEARSYLFELSPGFGETPYLLRFTYPAEAAPTTPAPVTPSGLYRVGGDRALRPDAISDDGAKTSIEWTPDQAMPATFARTRDGGEMLVEGHVRDGFYVLDGVYDRLVFRLGRSTANARRVPQLKR